MNSMTYFYFDTFFYNQWMDRDSKWAGWNSKLDLEVILNWSHIQFYFGISKAVCHANPGAVKNE